MKFTKKHLLATLFSFGLVMILITPILNSVFNTFGLEQIFPIKVTAQGSTGGQAQGPTGGQAQGPTGGQAQGSTGGSQENKLTPLGTLETVGKAAWGEKAPTGLLGIIGNVIEILLGLLGVIAVIFVVVGGFQWMTAGGNEEKIKGAKRVIGQGIVGLVIVLAAYAIAHFVIKQLIGPFLGGQQAPEKK